MRVNDALIQSAVDRGNITDLKNLALLLVDERNGLEDLLDQVKKTQPVDPFGRITVALCVTCNRIHMHVSCPRPQGDLRLLMERAMAAKPVEF